MSNPSALLPPTNLCRNATPDAEDRPVPCPAFCLYMTSGHVHIMCPAPTYQPVLRVLETCFKSNMARHAEMAMTVMKEEGHTHRSLENTMQGHT